MRYGKLVQIRNSVGSIPPSDQVQRAIQYQYAPFEGGTFTYAYKAMPAQCTLGILHCVQACGNFWIFRTASDEIWLLDVAPEKQVYEITYTERFAATSEAAAIEHAKARGALTFESVKPI